MRITRYFGAALVGAIVASSMSFAGQNLQVSNCDVKPKTENAVWGMESISTKTTQTATSNPGSCLSQRNQASAENIRGGRIIPNRGIREIVSQVLETAIWGSGFVPPPIR